MPGSAAQLLAHRRSKQRPASADVVRQKVSASSIPFHDGTHDAEGAARKIVSQLVSADEHHPAYSDVSTALQGSRVPRRRGMRQAASRPSSASALRPLDFQLRAASLVTAGARPHHLVVPSDDVRDAHAVVAGLASDDPQQVQRTATALAAEHERRVAELDSLGLAARWGATGGGLSWTAEESRRNEQLLDVWNKERESVARSLSRPSSALPSAGAYRSAPAAGPTTAASKSESVHPATTDTSASAAVIADDAATPEMFPLEEELDHRFASAPVDLAAAAAADLVPATDMFGNRSFASSAAARIAASPRPSRPQSAADTRPNSAASTRLGMKLVVEDRKVDGNETDDSVDRQGGAGSEVTNPPISSPPAAAAAAEEATWKVRKADLGDTVQPDDGHVPPAGQLPAMAPLRTLRTADMIPSEHEARRRATQRRMAAGGHALGAQGSQMLSISRPGSPDSTVRESPLRQRSPQTQGTMQRDQALRDKALRLTRRRYVRRESRDAAAGDRAFEAGEFRRSGLRGRSAASHIVRVPVTSPPADEVRREVQQSTTLVMSSSSAAPPALTLEGSVAASGASFTMSASQHLQLSPSSPKSTKGARPGSPLGAASPPGSPTHHQGRSRSSGRRSRLDPAYRRVVVQPVRTPAAVAAELDGEAAVSTINQQRRAALGAACDSFLATFTSAGHEPTTTEGAADVFGGGEEQHANDDDSGHVRSEVGVLSSAELMLAEDAESRRLLEQRRELVSLRQAVIIGVGSYSAESRIRADEQPTIDAAEVAESLNGMGFEVVLLSTAAAHQRSHGASAGEDDSASAKSRSRTAAATRRVAARGAPTRARIIIEVEQMNKRAQQALQQRLMLLRTPGADLIYGKLDEHPRAVPLVVFLGAGFSASYGFAATQQRLVRLLLPMDTTLAAAMAFTSTMPTVDPQPLTVDDLALAVSPSHPAPASAQAAHANFVIADCYAAMSIKPALDKGPGFMAMGGQRCVGSELEASYGSGLHRLLGSFYLKKGMHGYASRDGKLTLNALNWYVTSRMRKHSVECKTTASRHEIGDAVLAHAHELPTTRAESAKHKAASSHASALLRFTVLPLTNVDVRAARFARDLRKRLAKSLKAPQNDELAPSGSAKIVRAKWMSTRLTNRFALHTGSADLTTVVRDAAQQKLHQLRASQALVSNGHGGAALSYRLALTNSGAKPTGEMTLRTAFAAEQFLLAITRAPVLGGESSSPKAAGTGGGGVDESPTAEEPTLFKDPSTCGLVLDHFPVREIGAEAQFVLRCSEYTARKLDRSLRLGAVSRGDLIVTSCSVERMSEGGWKLYHAASRIQAAVRGRQLRRRLRPQLALLSRERRLRADAGADWFGGVVELQRQLFAEQQDLLLKREDGVRVEWEWLQRGEFAHICEMRLRSLQRLEASQRDVYELQLAAEFEVIEEWCLTRLTEVDTPCLAFLIFARSATVLARKQDHQRRLIGHEQAVRYKEITRTFIADYPVRRR